MNASFSRRAVLAGAVAAGVAVATAIAIPRVVSPQPEAAGIDQHHPDDAQFFSTFQLEGALEVERFATLEEMTTGASAAVTGRVVDVVSRTIVGEGSDRVGMVGLVIEPTVLNGSLPARFEDRLVVEFIGGSEPVETTAARLKRSLPKGEAVWFLRAKAEEVARYEADMKRAKRKISPATARSLEVEKRYYRLVSSQGLFIQGSDRIENPVADPDVAPNDPLIKQADKITKLSRLTATVENAR